MRLRWKKDPKEIGLRAIGAGPRGSKYTDGTEDYAWVYAHHWRGKKKGWWWGARIDNDVENHTDLELDEAAAKQQAQEFVKAHFARVAQPKEQQQ